MSKKQKREEYEETKPDWMDPRDKYLIKLRKISLFFAVLGMLLIVVGNIVPDEWLRDVWKLCIVVIGISVVCFFYYIHLAEMWGKEDILTDDKEK